jgi:hypothetical protein
MPSDVLIVPRAATDMEDLWTAPPGGRPVRLRRATDGAAPRLSCGVSVWCEREHLSVLFSYEDDHVIATHRDRDAPLYQEDVVEVFIAPETLRLYYEFEISPLGTIFDARVDSPDGDRATMHVDRAWDSDGLFAAVRSSRRTSRCAAVDVLVRIPILSVARSLPGPGDEWRANFFRIDRHPVHGDEFTAWRPTLRNPADFHVPSAFGILRFT